MPPAPAFASLAALRASASPRTALLCSRPLSGAPLRAPRRRPAPRQTPRRALSAMAPAPHAHGFDYDLLVLGAGSGGVRAARIAAGHGAHVAVAERGALGGTCVNVGCVPKKLFVYGSHYSGDFEDAEAYGWDVEKSAVGLDWPRLIENKNNEIARLNGIYARMLKNAGVDLKVGAAVMKDAHTVEIAGETVSADKVLVAVGGKPFVPDFEGSEHVITSNEAFFLKELPKKVIVVGGGYIGVEFASIFHGYGSDVTLMYRGDMFLRGFDHEVRSHLAEQMTEQGTKLKFSCDISKVVKNADGTLTASTTTGETLTADVIMFATGRVPDTAALGLDKAGVKTGRKGKIEVDDWGATSVENIYAVGDVTDRVNLTPVAIAEGHAFADTHYGGNKRNIGYDNIPTAVFSNPNIGTCGLTEEQARAKYGDDEIAVFKTAFNPMKHTLTKRKGERVFMKLLVVRSTDVVVGVHMLDAAAGDVIQLVGVAMKAGATKKHFDTTMPVHPVSAEEMVTLRTESEPAPVPAPAVAK